MFADTHMITHRITLPFHGEHALATVNTQGEVLATHINERRFHPISTSTVETLRKFWRQEYDRLGWDRSDVECIAAAIRNLLMDRWDPNADADGW